MNAPNRGEVWLVDLGYAAKRRPGVILSVPPSAQDRALATIVPHTTSVRSTAFEVNIPARYLQIGAFDAQGIATIALAKLIRKLGVLSASELADIEVAVKSWLSL